MASYSETREFILKVFMAKQDQLLNYLVDAMNAKGIKEDPFVNAACIVGNWYLQNRRPNDQTNVAVIETFKATLYSRLLGLGLTPLQPDIHSALEKAFVLANQLAEEARRAGQGGFGVRTEPVNFGIQNSQNAQPTAPIQGSSVPMASYTPAGVTVQPVQPAPVFGGTPQPQPQPQTQPAIIQPTVPQEAMNKSKPVDMNKETMDDIIQRANRPHHDILRVEIVEDYLDHELKEKIQQNVVSPKEANTRVKNSVYAEHRDWGDKVSELVEDNDKQYCSYDDAGIMVKVESEYRLYPMAQTETSAVYLQEFYSSVRQIIDDLDTVRDIDDIEKLMERVSNDVFRLRDLAQRLLMYFLTKSDENETYRSECSAFTRRFIATLTVLVHNAISVASAYGKDVPGTKFVQLECCLDDMTYFKETVYGRTIGENGVSKSADYFREMFLLIARSLRKLHIRLTCDNKAIELSQVTYTISLQADYQSANDRHIVEISSFGNSFEPIVSIYEVINQKAPEAFIKLKTPSHVYSLLSTGDVTAPVRY